MTVVTDPSTARAELARDGFIVLRGALSAEFVGQFRSVVVEHFRKKKKTSAGAVDALGRVPKTRMLLEQRQLFARVAEVLGYQPSYCHHSDIQINRTASWHRDSIDSSTYFDFCKTEIFDTNDYAVYKICVYCQDHQGGGGLSVIPGSHLAPGPPDVERGLPIATRVGDVILFDTRLYHQGIVSLEDRETDADRASCFMTLARDNPISRDFVNATIWRQNRQLRRRSYVLRGDLAAALERANLPPLGYDCAPQPTLLGLILGYARRAVDYLRDARSKARRRNNASKAKELPTTPP